MHQSPPAKSLSIGKRVLLWLATRLGWLVILALCRLTRIRFDGREHFEHLRDTKQRFIYCIWHGKIIIPIFVHRYENIHAMVSEHLDGEMIAQTLHRLGYATVRGSSTRGGSRAMIAMIRALKNGAVCGIMPDGPKGPRHEFKPGAIAIAQKAQAYLLPCTFASTSCWRLKSWDQFTIPKPFSTTFAVYGEPMLVPELAEGEEFETLRQEAEKRMRELEVKADELVHLHRQKIQDKDKVENKGQKITLTLRRSS